MWLVTNPIYLWPKGIDFHRFECHLDKNKIQKKFLFQFKMSWSLPKTQYPLLLFLSECNLNKRRRKKQHVRKWEEEYFINNILCLPFFASCSVNAGVISHVRPTVKVLIWKENQNILKLYCTHSDRVRNGLWLYRAYSEICCLVYTNRAFFWFGGILGSASRAKFPVSLSKHVGFTPRLLYSSTHHSSESFTHLQTGWAQDAWLQWSYENWYFHLDIYRWFNTNRA